MSLLKEMEQELTGLFTGDFHKLRVFQNDAMRDILDILSAPGGVPTIVQAGSGISVTEVSDKHFVVSNTAQGATGEPGKDGETRTTVGVPGDSDPGTETSARYKSEYGADERGKERLDDPAPRRPTSD